MRNSDSQPRSTSRTAIDARDVNRALMLYTSPPDADGPGTSPIEPSDSAQPVETPGGAVASGTSSPPARHASHVVGRTETGAVVGDEDVVGKDSVPGSAGGGRRRGSGRKTSGVHSIGSSSLGSSSVAATSMDSVAAGTNTAGPSAQTSQPPRGSAHVSPPSGNADTAADSSVVKPQLVAAVPAPATSQASPPRDVTPDSASPDIPGRQSAAVEEPQLAAEVVDHPPTRQSIRNLLAAALPASRWLGENAFRLRRLVRLPWLLPALTGGLALLAWRSGWHRSVMRQFTGRRRMAAVAVTAAVLVAGACLSVRHANSLPAADEAQQEFGELPSLSGRDVVVSDSLTVHPADGSHDRFVAPLGTGFEPLSAAEPAAEQRVAWNDTPVLRAPQPVSHSTAEVPRWRSETVEPTGYSIPETTTAVPVPGRSAWLTGTIEVPAGVEPATARLRRGYQR